LVIETTTEVIKQIFSIYIRITTIMQSATIDGLVIAL